MIAIILVAKQTTFISSVIEGVYVKALEQCVHKVTQSHELPLASTNLPTVGLVMGQKTRFNGALDHVVSSASLAVSAVSQ